MGVNEILQSLPSLPPDDLMKVRDRVTALLSLGGNGSVKSTVPDATRVALDIIATTLNGLGVDNVNAAWLAKGNLSSFSDKVKRLDKWMDEVGFDTMNKRRAALTIAVDMLYRDLIRMNVAPSGRTIMAHWHRIPALFERDFPGYAEAKILGIILEFGSMILKGKAVGGENVRNK